MTGTARPVRGAPAVATALGLLVLLGSIRPLAAHPGVDVRLLDLDRRLAAEPRSSGLWLERGRLLAEAHDWEGAESDLRRARKLDPALAAADLELARVHLAAGEPRRAARDVAEYLGKRPGDPAGLALRAEVHRRFGDPLAAAEDDARAIAAQRRIGAPAPPDWYLDRSRLLLQAQPPGAIDLALATLEEGLADLGQPAALEWEALTVERRAGRTDAALRRTGRMASAAAHPAPWLEARGEILEAAGRPAEARAAYATALEADLALSAPRRSAPAVGRRIQALRDAIGRLDAAGHADAGQDARTISAEGVSR
jgi:tetratricopeptide (TPR) repeat protein